MTLPELPEYWKAAIAKRRLWCPYCEKGIPFAKTWPPAHKHVVNKRASPNKWKRCWWVSPLPADRVTRKAIQRGAALINKERPR